MRATVTNGLVQWDAESVLAFGSEEKFVEEFMDHPNYELQEPKERKSTLKAVWKECKRIYKPEFPEKEERNQENGIVKEEIKE